MGCCAVLEYVTASWPKSIDPVVSLENVRLATVVHVRSTLPCGRSDRVKLPNRRNRIGLWRAPSRVMRLKAGPSLTPYELACALIEAVSSKLGSIHVGTSTPLRSTGPKAGTSMTVQFFKRILQKCCRHRFSWPHTGVHGQDYQVCLICGAAYEFDCSTMSRTGRVVEPEDLRSPSLPARPSRASRTD